MDAASYARYRAGGGDRSALKWEFGGVGGWVDAPAPGKVTEHVLTTAMAQNLTHWLTGIGWGVALGLATTTRPIRTWRDGPLLALAAWLWSGAPGPVALDRAWLTSYTGLPILKTYRSRWKYDASTVAKDLGIHVVYGMATAAALGALRRGGN